MVSTIPKEHSMISYPRTFLTIIASVVALAMFLCLASSFLVSQPIGFTLRNYFYGVATPVDQVEIEGQRDSTQLDQTQTNDGIRGEVGKEITVSDKSPESGQNSTLQVLDQHFINKSYEKISDDRGEGVGEKTVQGKELESSQSENSTTETYMKDITNVPSFGSNVNKTSSSQHHPKDGDTDSIDSECDLYHGKWVYDLAGPLYSNNSCPVLTQMQNCQGNGRPDKDYENWRWKPNQCDLPRFNPRKFLELMRGKTLAFIGDSVARNQMESMLCILWQAEEPKNRGNKRMQRYFFKSTSTMIVRIWSSWLVHQSTEPFDYAPAGVTKLHLDAPDEGFTEYLKEFDVVVLSSGHWFAKQSVYILNSEIVGGQLWWPDKSKKMKVNNVEAFGISVETILSHMVTNANYSGISIVRSYSPDHYEGGAWNTGGSCTGKVKPATDGELVDNGFTNTMHEKQVTGFNRAIVKQTNKSILKLMDITQVFSYRHDGHPGPYRNADPNKITKRGPDGKPPPQDCLHWCMPGPVDTWNELVSEIIRQEFEHKKGSP